MDIRVAGHQLDVGTSLTNHIEDSVGSIADKYAVGMTGANITLAPGPHDHGFACDIVVQLTQGLVMKSSALAHDNAQQAFQAAADKMDKQLRRYKRKLVDREKRGAQSAPIDAGYRVLQRDERDEADESEDNALVIAEMRVDIPEASVSDAVMLLDLRHTGALLFKNSQTGSYNMVYRREDGNVGWVEPQS